ncbi:MAG: CinA family protein [Clostridia bacterium]|nr:CinA family protein [Clostridia bacterium]
MLESYNRGEAVFKLFNLPVNTLNLAKQKIEQISSGAVELDFENFFGDITVFLRSKGASPLLFDKAVKSFINTFKRYIYADYLCELNENAIELLKISGRKISVAESFTGGSIASSLTAIAGASKVFYEGFVCYNTQAKIERLGVNLNTVREYTVVSREVACEMVRGLLEKSNCDVGVATTGYASPTGESDKPCGLCYIAVGDERKIQVFQYNFSGDREQITKQGKNAALFELNKFLKDNAI